MVTYHGEKDDLVPISQAEVLHERLRELNISEKLYRGKSGGHDFAAWPSVELTQAMTDMVEEIEAAIK